ncbi:hypothetical protein M0802_012736 [Mischocyttarus mexicanus]|nr:hypothetical protein M0802_012736 [Mischocyttarus mexicanus]
MLQPLHTIGLVIFVPQPLHNLTRQSSTPDLSEHFQQFWKRWSTECLQTRQTTSKWQTSQDTIKEGSPQFD